MLYFSGSNASTCHIPVRICRRAGHRITLLEDRYYKYCGGLTHFGSMRCKSSVRLFLLLGSFGARWRAEAFAPALRSSEKVGTTFRSRTPTFLHSTATNEPPELPDDADDEEEVEPGKMRVSEIKAELDLRGISYADCFDKEALVLRLEEARATGKADPSILEKFNKQKLEQQFKEEKVEVSDEDINAATANDGTVPGGLTPEQFKKLTSSPDIMTLLQSTKMQEAMTLMMTGGREDLENKLKEDPELQETVRKLDDIMKTLQ